jgi:sec-independent protein translocase protein TatA
MEVILLLAAALIVLGPKRLPGPGRALGQGIRAFRDGVTGTAGLVVEQDRVGSSAGVEAREAVR